MFSAFIAFVVSSFKEIFWGIFHYLMLSFLTKVYIPFTKYIIVPFWVSVLGYSQENIYFYYFDLDFFLKFYLKFFVWCIFLILFFLLIILKVAITTLYERKVLGRTQLREGPTFVGFGGFLQPFADAFKLIDKEIITPVKADKILHLGAPVALFCFSILTWSVIPLGPKSVVLNSNLGIIVILALSSINVYCILIGGWASNSRYAFLGALRAAAQMISYEVTLGIIILHVVCISSSFNINDIVIYQKYTCWFIFIAWPSFILFFIAALAETNRAPFDFPEAESELVSGINTELASIVFALFFLAEYANILLFSNLMVILFFGGWLAPKWLTFFGLGFLPLEFWYFLKLFLILTSFMVIRSTLPRFRYDLLMRLGWKVYVPWSVLLLFIHALITLIVRAIAP